MKKYIFSLIGFIIAFILQVGFAGVFPILGTSANFLLCVTVMISFLYPDNYCGLAGGIIFGFIYDSCMMEYLGVTSLVLFLTGIATIIARVKFLNVENIMSAVCVAAGSTVLYYNLLWVVLKACGGIYSYKAMLENLPMYFAWNFVIMMIIYLFYYRGVSRHKDDGFYRRK